MKLGTKVMSPIRKQMIFRSLVKVRIRQVVVMVNVQAKSDLNTFLCVFVTHPLPYGSAPCQWGCTCQPCQCHHCGSDRDREETVNAHVKCFTSICSPNTYWSYRMFPQIMALHSLDFVFMPLPAVNDDWAGTTSVTFIHLPEKHEQGTAEIERRTKNRKKALL